MDNLKRPCPEKCPWLNSQDCAMCSDNEQFIRHFMHGPVVEQMTEKEREWCVEDADHCGEGMYSKDELEKLDDVELAKATYHAWSAYVQSNCL